ncbi:PAS domain-containing sensor histidine kinase [Thaumasiovibrio subtropicus]|uniref:PAS domain-containing sensor histidine kinase n=1 Tax=Thaumasiovibrio subtropicus TaxID=1891207 RepID=UPI000B355741|nr:ATP-binding protein [Thaumasiovibrio subtropicus]
MTPLLPSKFKDSLSLRLLGYILLCSSILAVLITAVQLLWDYRQDVGEIKSNIRQIEVSFVESVAVSLWNLNEKQLEAQIDGIMNLPNLQYAVVKEKIGDSISVIVEQGNYSSTYEIQRQFELTNNDEVIGYLEVSASLEKVYKRLIEKSALILITQIIKTTLVSSFILAIIYYMVIRHLNRISAYTKQFDLNGAMPPLTLEGRKENNGTEDELDNLCTTLNQMQRRISAEFAARLEMNEKLENERDFSSTIIHASSTIICCLNPDYRVQTINKAGTDLIGMSETDAVGVSWMNLFVKADQHYEFEQVLQENPFHEEYELEMFNIEGRTKTLIWHFVPFSEGSSLRYVIAFGYDVTALKGIETELLKLNEDLEEKVQDRTASLNQSNAELRSAYAELKETQKSLLEAEKMASLGSLVAGISHEINTPIGISVTSSSFMKEEAIKLQKSVSTGKISKSALDTMVENISSSADLVLNSLEKAAKLIESFKQVAVNQTNEQRVSFNLSDNIEQVLNSLQYRLVQDSVEVSLNCDSTLVIDNYPGRLQQVFTNLVMNSLIHGFSNWHGPHQITITVNIDTESDMLAIEYHDNGRGIEKEISDRIFDPFVTSKLGQGGSGLGTHIIYNLIVQLMQGSIECDSEPGHGATFKMLIPLDAADDGFVDRQQA